MIKKTVKVKKELPEFLPQGWKKAVAERIGIHPFSMSRILRRRQGLLYLKIIETAKSLYGKVED